MSGFHKRKLQRKKKAQEELEIQLKDERKRLKQEARESYKKYVVSHRMIPELEHLLVNEYEEDDVNVKVTELSTTEIAKRNNWIGENKVVYDEPEDDEVEEEEDKTEIPGMEVNKKEVKKEEKKVPEFKTEKDVKKALKKQATKNIQKSKAFQMKNKIERQKQKKESFKKRKDRMKIRNQNNRNRGKGTGNHKK